MKQLKNKTIPLKTYRNLKNNTNHKRYVCAP